MANNKAAEQLKSTSFSTLLVVFLAFSGLFSYLVSDSPAWLRAISAFICTGLLNLEVFYERVKQFKAAQPS